MSRACKKVEERKRVELMTLLWRGFYDSICTHAEWDPSSLKLRTTGPGGSLWAHDISACDGHELVSVKFTQNTPTVAYCTETLERFGISMQRATELVSTAVVAWRTRTVTATERRTASTTARTIPTRPSLVPAAAAWRIPTATVAPSPDSPGSCYLHPSAHPQAWHAAAPPHAAGRLPRPRHDAG